MMKEPKDNLQAEIIDQVIDGEELSPSDHPTTHMIQQLHLYSQESARANERSLDRIWMRLSQSQEHPIMLPSQRNSSDDQPLMLTGRSGQKAMPARKSSWRRRPSFSLSQPGKHHPLMGVVSISLIAAVAIMTISSFAIFSHLVHLGSLTARQKTAISVKAQPLIHTAKPVCSVSQNKQPIPEKQFEAPFLDWSAQGQIALSFFSSVETFSAQNCTMINSQAIETSLESWSPDNQKLALIDPTNQTFEVLASQKTVLVNFPFAKLNALSIRSMIWSADSKNLTIVVIDQKNSESIFRLNVFDSLRGKVVAPVLLLSFPSDSADLLFSPNGMLLSVVPYSDKDTMTNILEIWNVESGKMTQTISIAQQNIYAQAFSPDGSLLALGTVAGSNQIQIYATATGRLVTSFNDPDSVLLDRKQLISRFELPDMANPLGSGLKNIAWSPDGKYLAESSSAIHIYALHTHKIVTTFGKVDGQHWISALAWSPNSTELVSTTASMDVAASLDGINIWQLN